MAPTELAVTKYALGRLTCSMSKVLSIPATRLFLFCFFISNVLIFRFFAACALLALFSCNCLVPVCFGDFCPFVHSIVCVSVSPACPGNRTQARAVGEGGYMFEFQCVRDAASRQMVQYASGSRIRTHTRFFLKPI